MPVPTIIARGATLSSGLPLILAFQLWVEPTTATGILAEATLIGNRVTMPTILAIQLWVDPTTAIDILAVATLIGDHITMPIMPSDIDAGGDRLKDRRPD